MTETAEVMLTDEGPIGVLLATDVRPRGCPGLGGWKRSHTGMWWTRVKGPEAKKLAPHCGYPGIWVTLTLEGDRITEIRSC